MLLSVIIVNYNVKYFLEQCLRSVYEASADIDTEVWVVDNNSTDGSVQMVSEKFPDVNLIVNNDNPGFAKANNQAINRCKGDYILLLNPDTLVQNDTFSTCLDFFKSHPDCGGLSVKMVNGEGAFLKESKRGFPSPATSFFKISGLIRIFPHSKRVGAYYLGHLDDDTVNEVDVLPGAFLMISRDAIQKTGLLDESYFMYGEDIDFSWRIKLAGYKNYYLPETRILHYKGESTRKSSMNYVYTFYNAMSIFAKKYFSKGGAKTYTFLIQIAIWLRASLDFMKRVLKIMTVPMLDFAVSFAGFLAIKHVWATYWAENVNYYPSFYTWGIIPIYVLILLISSWLAGGYDKPLRTGRIMQGMTIGALILLVFYSLLSEELRFSRAIVLMGSLWTVIAVLGIRGIMNILNLGDFQIKPKRKQNYLIIGSLPEQERVTTIFDTIGIEPKKTISIENIDIKEIKTTVRKQKINEVLFCGKDIPVKEILDYMIALNNGKVNFRIAPAEMNMLIGSNYTGSAEELYVPAFGNINNVTNRRSKRILDVISAVILLAISPLLFWFQKRKRRYFADCIAVLSGKKSWVGYTNPNPQSNDGQPPLPNIRCGVFKTRDRLPHVRIPDTERLDRSYADEYRISTDITILFINILKI